MNAQELAKQNAHLRYFERTSCSVLEHGAGLIDSHAGKPIDKLVYRGVVFEVLEQRGDGHPRTPEDSCAAHAIGITFDRGARGPINHDSDGSTGWG